MTISLAALGAAWLAIHPWEHYCFSQDREFLAQRAWPLMRGAARLRNSAPS